MIMQKFCCAVLCLLVAGICGAADTRPNLILIIADDMSAEDCGAYGNKGVQTPNLDRLAREGMRFTRGFVTTSSCSPSRASLITGKYPHNTGAEQLHWPLPGNQTTFVQLLSQAGYYTAAAGKWHLGPEVKKHFDRVIEAGEAGYELPANGKRRMVADDKSGCQQWVPTLQHRPKDKPCFLWLASLDPHRDYERNIIPKPHRPEDVVVPPFLPDVPATRKDLALYYDEIARLDGFVGSVLTELDAQNLTTNTLILFIGDNGRPFPRCKTRLYDSGIHSPWIVRWPGKVMPGTVCERLVSTVDIAPTFIKVAGLGESKSFEGKDFSALLENPEALGREFIYGEHHWHDFDACERAVRSEQFKYIRNYFNDLAATPPADAVRGPTFQAMRRLRNEGKLTPAQKDSFQKRRPAEELYDLNSDPDEMNNLAADPGYATTLAKLRQQLEAWQKETHDIAPVERTPDEFDRETGEPLPDRKRP